MEALLRELTVDQLKKGRPDLYNYLARVDISEERARLLSLVRYANLHLLGKGLEAVVFKAIENGTSLDALKQAVESVTKDQLVVEIKKCEFNNLSHLDRAKIYQNLNGCSMIEALRATYIKHDINVK